MKKPRPERDETIKVPMPFEEAVRRVLQVKPPPGGWKALDREADAKLRRRRPPKAG